MRPGMARIYAWTAKFWRFYNALCELPAGRRDNTQRQRRLAALFYVLMVPVIAVWLWSLKVASSAEMAGNTGSPSLPYHKPFDHIDCVALKFVQEEHTKYHFPIDPRFMERLRLRPDEVDALAEFDRSAHTLWPERNVLDRLLAYEAELVGIVDELDAKYNDDPDGSKMEKMLALTTLVKHSRPENETIVAFNNEWFKFVMSIMSRDGKYLPASYPAADGAKAAPCLKCYALRHFWMDTVGMRAGPVGDPAIVLRSLWIAICLYHERTTLGLYHADDTFPTTYMYVARRSQPRRILSNQYYWADRNKMNYGQYAAHYKQHFEPVWIGNIQCLLFYNHMPVENYNTMLTWAPMEILTRLANT